MKKMFMRGVLPGVLVAGMLASSAAFAAKETYDCTDDADYPRCLSGNVPSYLVYADDGERHMEFSLSIKYPLFGRDKDNSIYFAYTGDYDFYIFTRDSAPVVQRRHNPGLFFQRQLKGAEAYGLERYQVGWFHESNGQAIETQEEFAAAGEDAIDRVSRGWDYASADLKFKFPFGSSHLDFYTVLNVYCNCQALGMIDEREDDIFWEDVDEQPKVTDFNGLKAILDYTTQGKTRYILTLRTGTSDLESLGNVSYRLSMVYRAGDVPLTLFYFNGYGINLSTYNEKADYYGIGFEFW